MSKKKILLIEDDLDLQVILKFKLTKWGFDVTLASTGKTGLDLADTDDFELVLLDLILPEMNGFDVLKNLKDNNKTRDIPVLIFSNIGNDKDIVRAKDLGAIDFLLKAGTDLDDLVERIKLIMF